MAIPSTALKGTRTQVAHVAIVLDRSGSMESCRDATIHGFNEYADNIRKTVREGGLDARLTLTVFNHEIEVKECGVPLDRLQPLSRETYVPDGMTAMLDAVGETVARLEAAFGDGPDASFLVCVISDGYENSSKRFSYADIAERIQRLTGTGRWTFTYLGSNQDLSKVSQQLHIPEANVAAYAATPVGTQEAWQRHSRATARRMRSVESAAAPTASDFYAEEPAERQ